MNIQTFPIMAQKSFKVALYIDKCNIRQFLAKRTSVLSTNTTRSFAIHRRVTYRKPKHARETNVETEKISTENQLPIFKPLALDYIDNSNITSDGHETENSLVEMKERLDDIRFDIEMLKKMKEKILNNPSEQLDSEYSNRDKMLFGTPDPNEPSSIVPCGGCGAILHCNDTAIPGFVPQEKFKEVRPMDRGKLLCLRCCMISFKNQVIDLDTDERTYKKIVKRIKQDMALVVMVVDVTDMGNSVIHDYLSQIGTKRPIVIVGNKVDLIPKDGKGHLNRIQRRLEDECHRANLNPKYTNIKHVCLISAKTGYGIEELINALMKYWATQGQVYLVGTTNSGKSTLFNKFLSSDYCKSTCRDITQRATVSRWPGTTLNLIKFPIARLSGLMQFLRVQRLQEDRLKDNIEIAKRTSRLNKFGKSENAVLFATVGKTEFRSDAQLEEEERKFVISGQDFPDYSVSKDGDIDTDPQGKLQRDMWTKRETMLEEMYPDSKWVFDTPGLVNKNQLINKLTAPELRCVLKREMIRPRVYVMKPGDVMFITGLGRIDYLEGKSNTMFTVHTTHLLPVQVVSAEEADEFYLEHVGTPTLGLPLGDTDRLNKLPSLSGRDFYITTEEPLVATTDLQLSSLGWVSFAGKNKHMHIRAYTPEGRGMHLRTPALLPNILPFKGIRLGGKSKGYAMKKLQR